MGSMWGPYGSEQRWVRSTEVVWGGLRKSGVWDVSGDEWVCRFPYSGSHLRLQSAFLDLQQDLHGSGWEGWKGVALGGYQVEPKMGGVFYEALYGWEVFTGPSSHRFSHRRVFARFQGSARTGR